MNSPITVTVQTMTGELLVFTHLTSSHCIGHLKREISTIDPTQYVYDSLHLVSQEMVDFSDDPFFELTQVLRACDSECYADGADQTPLCDGEIYMLSILPPTYLVTDIYPSEVVTVHRSDGRYIEGQLGIIRMTMQHAGRQDQVYLNIAYSLDIRRFRHYHESYFRMDNAYSCMMRDRYDEGAWFETFEECLRSIAESRCLCYLISEATIQNILRDWTLEEPLIYQRFEEERAWIEDHMEADEQNR